jgi:3',5'-cyclic AMP phosphodiesterase CpdA
MRLLAISDLHLAHRVNREALEALGRYPDDWLIVAGDVGETPARLVTALRALVPRFARVIWTPGNHDLWCPGEPAHAVRT